MIKLNLIAPKEPAPMNYLQKRIMELYKEDDMSFVYNTQYCIKPEDARRFLTQEERTQHQREALKRLMEKYK